MNTPTKVIPMQGRDPQFTGEGVVVAQGVTQKVPEVLQAGAGKSASAH